MVWEAQVLSKAMLLIGQSSSLSLCPIFLPSSFLPSSLLSSFLLFSSLLPSCLLSSFFLSSSFLSSSFFSSYFLSSSFLSSSFLSSSFLSPSFLSSSFLSSVDWLCRAGVFLHIWCQLLSPSLALPDTFSKKNYNNNQWKTLIDFLPVFMCTYSYLKSRYEYEQSDRKKN